MAIKLAGNAATVAEVESVTRALRITPRPIDWGSLGVYEKMLASGIMAAGLSADSPVFSFRNSSANVYLLNRVRLTMGGLDTAFAAGQATFKLFPARSFTVSDSGGTAGTLSGHNGKLRASMSASGLADIRIASTATLTAGTRTKDADPIAGITFGIGTAASAIYVPPNTVLFEAAPDEQPFIMVQNEGFVVEATVPGTGTWCFGIDAKWTELASYAP